MKASALLICALGLVFVWSTVAYGDAVVASVQFPFKIAGKEYPSGKYRINANVQNDELTITNMATQKRDILPFATRISAREGESELVFDKQGDQYYLSEIYMPGIDGFELHGATGKHTHVKVKAGK